MEEIHIPGGHEGRNTESQENIHKQKAPNHDFTINVSQQQARDQQWLSELRQQNSTSVENENQKFELERKAVLEKAQEGFKKLKSILDSGNIPIQVKELLLDADVSGVIAGIKPASYIQPSMAGQLFGRWGRFGEGIIPKELEQFRKLLIEFNIESSIMRNKRADKFKKEMGVELVYIFRRDEVLSKMDEVRAFSDEEVDLAENNMGFFFSEYLTLSNPSQETLRVGFLYGYPPSDVRDAIQMKQIGEKLKLRGVNTREEVTDQLRHNASAFQDFTDEEKELLNIIPKHQAISVNGINGDVGWGTYRRDSLEVQEYIRRFTDVFELERKVLNR